MVLQHFTPSGWRSLAQYGPNDAGQMQGAAAAMSQCVGLRWRVLSDDGRVLTVYSYGRWHVVGEADTPSSDWVTLEDGSGANTVPVR